MTKRGAKRLFGPITFLMGLLFVIALWELIAYLTGYKFLPEFFHALSLSFGLLGEGSTWSALGWSALRLLVSLTVSSLIGMALGLLAGYYEWLGRFLSPIMTVLKAFPTVALILLLVIYVPHSSLYVVGVVLLPVAYQAAAEGSSSVYSRFERQILLEGRGNVRNLTRIILPLSSDYLLLGFIQSLGLGIKVEVMAETFAYGSNYQGIGKSIYLAYQTVEYDRLMAYVLLILAVAILVDISVMSLKKSLKRKIGLNNSLSGD